MLSKVELELKKRPDPRRSFPEARQPKVELELKDPQRGREKEVNLIFTDSWQQYSDCSVSSIISKCMDGKEMLVYRGKRSDASINSSDSGNSSHSDEHERSQSTLSDLLSSPEGVIYEVDGESDAGSPPRDPSHQSPTASPTLSANQQDRQVMSPRQHRFCWYCFDAYKAMCLAQGKTPPSVYSRGLWHGHCMRDSNGAATCPHLWFTTCPHCGATGSNAHSPDFCPVLELAGLNLRDK